MTTRSKTFLLWLTTAATSALAAGRLPERVPVHWGLDGQPDRWGSRWELLLLGPLLLPLVAGIQYAIDRKDPIKDPDQDASPRERVVLLAMALLAFIHAAILAHVGGLVGDMLSLLCGGLSLFWLLMGNVMGRVKPNATTGIRTPWTYRSPEIWRRTHRLAGQLMFVGGLLGLLGAMALPGPAQLLLVLSLIAVGALGPVVYSYLLWRDEAPRA